MRNTIFSEVFSSAGNDLGSTDPEIEAIQQQLNVLRARLRNERTSKADLTTANRIRAVRNFCHARSRRAELIGRNLFSDPTWDILLHVYLAELEQRRLSVSAIVVASAIPLTTVVRWLARLEEVGLLHKQGDPLDGRRIFVSLTDKGMAAMTAYLDECWPLLT